MIYHRNKWLSISSLKKMFILIVWKFTYLETNSFGNKNLNVKNELPQDNWKWWTPVNSYAVYERLI